MEHAESKTSALTIEQEFQLKVFEQSFQELNQSQLRKLMLVFVKQSMLQNKIEIVL